MEQAIAEQLQGFLDKASALDPFQSSFHLGFGTKRTLIAVNENLWLHHDAGRMVLLILLDLSAVFDTANQLILVSCLAILSVRGRGLELVVLIPLGLVSDSNC